MSYREAASLEHTRVTPADQTKRYTNWNTALKKPTDNAYVNAAVQGKETLAKREPAEGGSQLKEENKATLPFAPARALTTKVNGGFSQIGK